MGLDSDDRAARETHQAVRAVGFRLISVLVCRAGTGSVPVKLRGCLSERVIPEGR